MNELHKITFDGFNLHDFCVINRALPTSVQDGSILQFKIDITIKNDVEYNIDMLNRILFTKEPKRLVLGSQPDRYLLCQLVGNINFSSRFYKSEATLTFESQDGYWYTDYGDKQIPFFKMERNGIMRVENKGTAPTPPEIFVEFPSDNGYLAVIAPNGYIELGSKEEQDKENVPSSHRVMNEEMHASDMTDWTRITSNNHGNTKWVGDYNKLNIGTGEPNFDKWGIKLTKSQRPKSGHYWNSWAYVKEFDESDKLDPAEFNNWKLEASLFLDDASGGYGNTFMYLIIVMDKFNKPIMTTSAYNVSGNTNEITMTAKINDFKGSQHTSKIISTAKFPNGFHGHVHMQKEGNVFSWWFDSGREQYFPGKSYMIVDTFLRGQTAYIRNSATHYYHYNGSRHPILSFTRNRANKITGIRTFKGKKQYEISYRGTKIAWLNEEDLTKDPKSVGWTPRQRDQKGQKIHHFRTVDSRLAGLVASKVMVVGGTWDTSSPFTYCLIDNIKVDRINNSVRIRDIKNTFNKGDVLTINNAKGEILLNNSTYQGYIDPASRFFNIDYGESDIYFVKSDWASLPEVSLELKERWR